MAKRRAFPMLLTNRTEVPVPVELALSDRLLGVDAANRLVVATDDGPRALTECHAAVATAVPNGELAVCPSCDPDSDPYVDAYFGRDAIVATTFVALTPAEVNAAKQGWKIDATPTIGALRTALAAVTVTVTPTASQLSADPAFRPELERTTGAADSPRIVAATAEAARLERNAKVNAWRDRQRLQAAIDRRGASFALLRAAKTAPTVADEGVDVAGPVDALAGVTSDADGGL